MFSHSLQIFQLLESKPSKLSEFEDERDENEKTKEYDCDENYDGDDSSPFVGGLIFKTTTTFFSPIFTTSKVDSGLSDQVTNRDRNTTTTLSTLFTIMGKETKA